MPSSDRAVTATDLNPAMLEVGRAKFASHEQVSLQRHATAGRSPTVR